VSKLLEYLLVIGSFQGVLLFALLTLDKRMSTASRVLGVICLMMASVLLMPFFLVEGSALPAWLAGWLFYLPAAGGSLAYLYCRSALLDRPLGAADALLFLPASLCYLLAIDTLLTDPQRMLAWIGGALADDWRLPASEYLEFLQALAFAGATMFMIWKYRAEAGRSLANYDPRTFEWMLMLQLFTLAIWFLKALPALSPAPIVLSQVADLLMVIVIYLIAITQWREPHFFLVPRLDAESLANHLEDEEGAEGPSAGELDCDTRAHVFERLRNAMEQQQLYLDNELTLSKLAEATGLSRHHVSETLNRHAGQNFYEFINSYRIQVVCERLISEQREPVLNIALEAGFASKSAFNAIFKQFTHMTPTAWRRKHRGQGAGAGGSGDLGV